MSEETITKLRVYGKLEDIQLDKNILTLKLSKTNIPSLLLLYQVLKENFLGIDIGIVIFKLEKPIVVKPYKPAKKRHFIFGSIGEEMC